MYFMAAAHITYVVGAGIYFNHISVKDFSEHLVKLQTFNPKSKLQYASCKKIFLCSIVFNFVCGPEVFGMKFSLHLVSCCFLETRQASSPRCSPLAAHRCDRA